MAAGRDRLRGDAGNDELVSYDKFADRVDCGAGRDVAYVDRRDTVTGCEKVIRPGSSKRR